MKLVVTRRELTEPGELQALVVDHVEGIEPGLVVLDSRLLLGQATIDAVALDGRGSLVLIAVGGFDDDLSFFELAERLGYDKVWIAEHLFSSYGLVTSTQVYAAAIAQRTKKVRIGMAVCAIPFNHPLRTASDFALVDILSHGRLDFGV